MASKLAEIVNFGSSTWPVNKYCDIRSYPAEAIVVHEPDDTYATSQPSSKARPFVRGVACPPQWLPVLLAGHPPPPSPLPPSPPSPPSPSMRPGYVQISGGYYMIESGSCGGGLISTVSECDAAATALHLSDQTAYDYTSGTYSSIPPGCQFASSRWLLVFGAGSTGSCSPSKQCICRATPP